MALSQAQRNQRAYDKGFRGKDGGVKGAYAAYRAAPKAQQAASSQRLAARDPGYRRVAGHQVGRAPVGGRRSVFVTAAGDVIRGPRVDVLTSRLRRAADSARYLVDGTVTLPNDAGDPEAVDLGQHGGMWPLADFRRADGRAVLIAIIHAMYVGQRFRNARPQDVEAWTVTVGD